MPNRILKESICASDSIDSLSWFEEVLFYRLIVNCDDYGRFDGRISVIKNRLFPLKENITAQSVKKSIDKLATVGLVAPYEFGGKPYLQLPTWENHQIVRAKKSKYPPFDTDLNTYLKAIENNCNQMNTKENDCFRNPIQSESNPNPESESKSTARVREKTAEDLFPQFWEVYPKHVGKASAEKAFRKLDPDSELLNTILLAVDAQKNSDQWKRENGQYIPYPATWLNQRRWEDEMTIPENNTLTNPFLQYLKKLDSEDPPSVIDAPYEEVNS